MCRTGSPAMATIRSSTCSPARDAALPAPLRRRPAASPDGRPSRTAAANSTIASRKLAIGPAATTMARDATLFSWNVSPGNPAARGPRRRHPPAVPGRAASRSRRAASRRFARLVPRRSVQRASAWPKPIENTSHTHAAPARREVMPEFMHEHEHAKHHDEGEAACGRSQGCDRTRVTILPRWPYEPGLPTSVFAAGQAAVRLSALPPSPGLGIQRDHLVQRVRGPVAPVASSTRRRCRRYPGSRSGAAGRLRPQSHLPRSLWWGLPRRRASTSRARRRAGKRTRSGAAKSSRPTRARSSRRDGVAIRRGQASA